MEGGGGGGVMLQELECIQFQRITLKVYSKKCLLGNFCLNLQKKVLSYYAVCRI